jgi:hypothetical protein
MKRALGFTLLLASCSHPAVAPATPGPATPLLGQVVSMETGPSLKVVVSFRNDGSAACQVTSYALAWGHAASAPRAKCGDAVAVAPHASAEATCMIPDSSPMRDAAGRTEAPLEILDVVSSCPAAQ